MDNKHNSLNLAAKICSDICPWTLSVPRSLQFSSSFTLGNCSLRGTDNVRGQISEHILGQMKAIVYIFTVLLTERKMARRFAKVSLEEIVAINEAAVAENTKKATKFGL